MTAAEAIERLNSMTMDDDPEESHGIADGVLLEVMRSHDLADVANAWKSARNRVGFWYA